MDSEILHYSAPNDRLSEARNASIQSHNQIVALIKDIQKNGGKSSFVKMEDGLFRLNKPI